MAIEYKILGQVAPTANQSNTVYTVPAGRQAITSTINICNQDLTVRSCSIAIVKSGETLSAKHYIAFNLPVPFSDSVGIAIGATLNSNDSIVVSANNSSNLSFCIFGSEIY